jgi:soluble lytic murein transglycosylase-like protein
MNKNTKDLQIAARLDRLNEMMSDMLARDNPAERDRRMQQFMAQGMTAARRLELLAQMSEFVLQAGPRRSDIAR